MFHLRQFVRAAGRLAIAWIAATLIAAGLANPASAQAEIDMFFNAASIPLGGTTVIIFNFENPSGVPLTNVGFVDTLPSGIVVASPSVASSNCGGTVTAAIGSGTITLTGVTLAPAAVCTLAITVRGITAGLKTNTVTVTSDQGTGNTDTDPMTVNQGTSASTLVSSTNPSMLDQPVTFTATVTGVVGTPTGTVTFRDGATTLGTGTLSGGTATFTTSALTAGTHAITAVHGGDTSFIGSTSAALTQTVLPNGTITLRVATTDGDGTFAFASATPGLALSLTTSGGIAQSSGVSFNAGTYTATVTPPAGFGLTSVSCSDGDSTGDVASKSATIRLASDEAVICTFSAANSRAKTVETIHRFMSRRNDLIMSNAPDGNRQVDRLIEAQGGTGAGPASGFVAGGAMSPGQAAMRLGSGFAGAEHARTRSGRRSEPVLGPGSISDADDIAAPMPGVAVSPFRFTGSSDGATQMSFSTSLRQVRRFVDEAEARKAGAPSGLGFSPMAAPARTARPSPFDVWIEGRYASFNDDRDSAGLDGHFALIYVGADYVLNRSLLVGALVQFDSMRQSSFQLTSDVSGHGWMAGPYATLRLTENVFLQARAAWGRSDNEISPYLTYTDEFQSERWLVSSTVTGRWQHGPWQFRPSASLSLMEDVAEGYTDSLGVAIPDVKVRLGQARAGPAISYSYLRSDGSVLEPRLALDAIWNFAADDPAFSVSGAPAGPEGVRGRVELGVRATAANGLSLDLSGSYDGIGSNDFDAVIGRAMVRVPLN